jgi:hypothetical protein
VFVHIKRVEARRTRVENQTALPIRTIDPMIAHATPQRDARALAPIKRVVKMQFMLHINLVARIVLVQFGSQPQHAGHNRTRHVAFQLTDNRV